MKALVYEGGKTLTYRDVADASPQGDELLVRIDAVGICGSDMHAYLGHDERRPPPLILGHEGAGVIMGGARDGERVTINPLVTCGRCNACLAGKENLCPERQIISMPAREGAFAQYVSMPAENLVPVPDGVSLVTAALAEPLAVGWHALRLALKALGDDDCQTALVIGGGAIGVAAWLALHALSDNTLDAQLMEPNAARREYLDEVAGIPARTDADEIAGGFDLVVDAVGLDVTRASASRLVRPGGVIVHIGLGDAAGGLDIRRITLQEITFIGTYTYTMADFRDTADAIFDGHLGNLDWVETRPLSAGADAFAELLAGRIAAPKIVLEPWAS